MTQEQGLPARTMLPASADEAFDRIAGLVRTVIDVPVALVSLVDQACQVFPGAVGLGEPWMSERSTPLSHSFCQHVVVSAAPLIVTDARLDPVLKDNLAIRDLGVIAYAGMPLRTADGTVVGSLCAIDHEPRVWTPSELGLLADLAAACAAELQLREAVTRTAASVERSGILLELAESLSSSITVEDVTAAIGTLAVSRLGAVSAAIALVDEGGSRMGFVDLANHLPSADMSWADFPLNGPSMAALTVRTRLTHLVEDIVDLERTMPATAGAIRGSGARSAAFVPLHVGGRTLGAVAVLWPQPQRFSAEDRELLDGLARGAAQAVDRAQLLAERRNVAQTLQAALLPQIPDVGWLEMAGLYRAAHTSDSVGGDWYDAFTLADKSLMVAVGDVTGHDSSAAAAMGQIRTALRALVLDAPDTPAAVLTRLDRIMPQLGHGRLATLLVAALSPADDGAGMLSWSNAGHLPPLLLAPGRQPEFLTAPVNRLLGLFDAAPRCTHHQTVPPGSTILLYTDGLVERRTTDLQDGLDALAYAASLHRELPLTRLIDAVLEAALAGGQEDDTVILGIRTPD